MAYAEEENNATRMEEASITRKLRAFMIIQVLL
jgi:hypothetical protein